MIFILMNTVDNMCTVTDEKRSAEIGYYMYYDLNNGSISQLIPIKQYR